MKRKRIKQPIFSSNTFCSNDERVSRKVGRRIINPEIFDAHTVTMYDYIFGYIPSQNNSSELYDALAGK